MSDPSAITPLTPPKLTLPPLTAPPAAAAAPAAASIWPEGPLPAPAEAPEPAAAPAGPAAKASVLDRLRAHKESRTGETTFVLPETGVTVSLPKFRSHDAWMKAQRMGKNDSGQVQVYYIIELAKFDGERLTAGDYRELIPAADHLKMINEVFNTGESGGEGDEKN